MSIFKNETGYRVGWKILLAILLYVAAMMFSIIPAILIYNFGDFTSLPEMVNLTMNSSIGNALQAVFSIAILWGICYLLVKKKAITWEKLGLDDSLSSALKKAGIGFICGAIVICVEIAVLCIFHYASLSKCSEGQNAIITVVCGLVICAGIAFAEEVTFRGLIQGQFGEDKKALGIVVTTILFAAAHLLNTHYTVYSLIYLLIGSLAFSLMRVVTKGLWFPIGFHMAWDWVEMSVFGLNQEGTKHWFYVKGEEIPEYLICAVLMLFVTVVLLLIYRKQKA